MARYPSIPVGQTIRTPPFTLAAFGTLRFLIVFFEMMSFLVLPVVLALFTARLLDVRLLGPDSA